MVGVGSLARPENAVRIQLMRAIGEIIMSKVIVGIHGLANKLPKDEVETYWKKALVEGLEKNRQVQNPEFDFKLVYWADLLYKHPLHSDEKFYFDDLYDNWPYVEAKAEDLKEYRDSLLDGVRQSVEDVVGSAWDALRQQFGMSELVAKVIRKQFRDLNFYYDEERKIANRAGQFERARTVLRGELKAALQIEKGRDIMLIAHSMGSIIAYDVLRELAKSDPALKVSHLATIGSPLGLTPVKHNILDEFGEVCTPSVVTQSWANFADKRDIVASDEHLADDYGPNPGGIKVQDELISNDYRRPLDGKPDYHKIYGYLRAPEFSQYFEDFLR